MGKKALLLSLLIVVGFFVFFLSKKNEVQDNTPGTYSAAIVTAENPATTDQMKAPAATAISDDSKTTAEFKQWFSSEAENVEKSASNPKVKELELRERVYNMQADEIRFLGKQSVDMSGPAKQRILATYLLTIAPNKTAETLFFVMEAPLQITGDAQVHSTDETLSAQEHSLRRMAIDALIEKARQDPRFKNQLNDRIPRIENIALQDYAKRRIRELK
ncbi:hypothetical protein [Bdellovibrio reynosensis]|uniref:Uncharacterized protein n=1 Tax=Bdellovibrio reynosensis TaxID=2835041 RepID=A0ABY4C8P0_9BACT|nr:hypothetical protein [Bdellovibrio reynosensis]UOF01357.1 hypothetical protein MNR06_00115 [Bdellovibrio reynosensis]